MSEIDDLKKPLCHGGPCSWGELLGIEMDNYKMTSFFNKIISYRAN